MAGSPIGGASGRRSEEQSARSCRSIVVRAARGDRETSAQRTLRLSAGQSGGALARTSEPRERSAELRALHLPARGL